MVDIMQGGGKIRRDMLKQKMKNKTSTTTKEPLLIILTGDRHRTDSALCGRLKCCYNLQI